MHKTEGANHSNNLFVNGPPGTRLEKNWLNAVQNELTNAIEGAGLTLKTAATETGNQLLAAISSLIAAAIAAAIAAIPVIKNVQTAKNANYPLVAADLYGRSTFTNDGAGGQINFTWPTLVFGQKTRFIVVNAQYLKITAPSGKRFRYLATRGAAAGYIRANTVGNVIECEATADDIVITSIGGAWRYDE